MNVQAKSSNQIVISYRREDSAAIVGRIYDRLVEKFGRDAVFKDVDSIPLGVDFRKHLDSIVAECSVLLVVVGDRWFEHSDSSGQRRLDDPHDFVRIEVESALRRNIPVIPLLVQNAALPPEEKLPEAIRELSFRNGMSVGYDPHFQSDIARLISNLEIILMAEPASKPPPQDAPTDATPRAESYPSKEGKSDERGLPDSALPLSPPADTAVPRQYVTSMATGRHEPELNFEVYAAAFLLGTLVPVLLATAGAYAAQAINFIYVDDPFNPTDAYPSMLLVGEMCAAYTLMVIGFAVGWRRRQTGWKIALCISAVPFLINLAGVIYYLQRHIIYLNHIFFLFTAILMTPLMPLLTCLGLHLGALDSVRKWIHSFNN
ncbi:MAG TPA: toll/interleukin-1 receptor domain-containing protein [Pyrinomonadaceae bacterium]|nr:toll/interleukin-1 receptor domain-containing protein [Pyrinomonadaceae bacterium]